METIKFEYTNQCSCQNYNEDTDTFTDSEHCYGDCWDFTVEDFQNITEHLFNKNETNWWRVSGLRLWNGDIDGVFTAQNATDLLQGMSVRSDWLMRGEVFEDRIEYSLSHHDAPMGSSSTLTMITEEEVVKLGLY